MSERVMPHNLEAERSVLGAVFIDNQVYPVAAAVIERPEMFYRRGHQVVWKRMSGLADTNQPIDLFTVKDSLERAGELEEAGGYLYLSELTDGVPRATNVEYYARVVREKFLLRRAVQGAAKISELAFDTASSADTVIDEAERIVMSIGQSSVATDFVLADDWARELYAQIEYATQNKRLVTGVPTGMPALDRYTRGFQAPDLVYIGARPSVGKTALMMQLASQTAEHTMTGIVSLEMARKDVGLRLVSMEARVPLFDLQTGFIQTAEQHRQIAAALERIRAKRLAIDDAAGLTDSQLRAKVRRLAARYGLGIVFIDYAQLLRGSEKAENRNLEMTYISAGMKALAKELSIPIVLLSQLTRDNDKANRRPRLSDLRDSGSLEQDADLVMLLHRPGQHDDGQRYGDGEAAELIIAKHRNGPTGLIDLVWMGTEVRFGEKA